MRTIRVPGKQAVTELLRLRSEYGATGLCPVLFGDEEDYSRIRQGMEFPAGTLMTADESLQINPEDWFANRPKEDPGLYQFSVGEWPSKQFEATGITSHIDILTREPKKEVVIGLLEIGAPYEAFIQLRWGGWNDCPFPAEHTAIHRYWQANWGAEVVCVTSDVVECVVSRPPNNRKTAIQLAIQQYIYCYDIVEQGTDTIAALAAALIDSPTWYFWWD